MCGVHINLQSFGGLGHSTAGLKDEEVGCFLPLAFGHPQLPVQGEDADTKGRVRAARRHPFLSCGESAWWMYPRVENV